MRYKRVSNFVNALFLSIIYVIVFFFTLIGTARPPTIHMQEPEMYPLFSILFLFISLSITWGLYWYFGKTASKTNFLISILVGVALILIGISTWAVVVWF